ncbi:MAG: laccase domain-containing protein [Deltaproteobacteria bacterium]|nr:MAG: laccase domain-containing protein [Deltaproteobacteria bacterium]
MERPGVAAGVTTADCVPVILSLSRGLPGAVLHAGWRGIVKGIIREGVAKLLTLSAAPAGEVVAALGPAIGPCCYAVGEEVLEIFRERWPASAFVDEGGRGRVDLRKAVFQELVEIGVPPESVDVSGECTCCGKGYFSYRRDRNETRRQVSLLYYVEM